MRYDCFEIDMYDEDNDSKHENTLFNYAVSLDKLLIKYEVSSIPTVEIDISSKFVDILSSIKNLYIIITINDSKAEYNVGVTDFIYKGGVATIYGNLCKYDDIFSIGSSYLGDTFVSCVKSLNIKEKLLINGKNGYDQDFDNDFPFKYWKIQESNIQTAHKILQQAYKKSIYTMDNNYVYINTIDYDNTTYNYESMPPNDGLLYISKNDKIDYLLKQDKNTSTNNLVNVDDDKTPYSMNTSMGRTFIGETSDVSLINYTSSLPLQIYQGNYLIKCMYKNAYVPFVLGNSMKAIDLNVSTTSNWFVISKVERYSAQTGLQTAVLFSSK